MHKTHLFLLLLLVLLSACSAPPALPSATPGPSATSTAGRISLPTINSTPGARPTQRALTSPIPSTLAPSRTPTLAPSATPSPTLPARPAANAWKEWPILPGLTGRAFEIYNRAIRLGNDLHAFSKVADCQGIREVLLGNYDLPGGYQLTAENAALQETIDWFSGSFNRNGLAVMGGYNARSVLQPEFADPGVCAAGESPLECEVRIHRPSIALVSLEFGYDGRTTANYEAYLRRTIEFLISKAVLPILATKADNYEGDQSLNWTTAKLALEYDLPLWNWWRAAQPLPNHGLDISRPDGFHISVDAWQVRSATALQSIDAVWRGLRGQVAIAQAAYQPSATPTAGTPTAAVLAADQPVLDKRGAALAVSGHVLVGLGQRSAQGYDYPGIFALDPAGSAADPLRSTPVLGAGWYLQAVSADGKSMLANKGPNLWLVPLDGSAPAFLTDGFIASGRQGAAWAPDNKSVLFTALIGGEWAVYLYETSSNSAYRLSSGAGPLELYPAADAEKVYFLSGRCKVAEGMLPIPLDCTPDRTWSVPYTTPTLTDLPGVFRPAFSSDGVSLAYSFFNERDRSVLAVTTVERAKVWSPLPDGYAVDYAWSPSGRWLAALLLERSDYSGKPGGLRAFLLNPLTLDKVELPSMGGVDARLAWSADGHYVLAAATDPLPGTPKGSAVNTGFRLTARLYDARTGKASDLDGKMGISGAEYIFVTTMYWLP